jgi:hypothetical protein
VNRNVLIRINTPDPARLWSGAGDLLIPIDDVENEIATYFGGGELISGLDEIDQLINGTARRIDLNVSGVTPATVKLFLEEREALKGAAMDIGIVRFDEWWQVEDVSWRARYRIDKASVSRQAERVISLSMGSEDTGRSRSSGVYWTDAAQQRRSPGDRIFDRVALYNAGSSRQFGPSE